MKIRVPSENQEQIAVVRALRRSGICFAAVPNGGYRTSKGAIALRMTGVQAGVPDLLIFDPVGEFVGTGLEMKREGSTHSAVSDEQRRWLERLKARGWATVVGKGANDALVALRALGYDIRG